MFRNYGFLFWTFAYPIIMALFYYLAFSGMMNISVDSIPVGINSDNEILFILEEIDFLDIHLIDDNEYVEKLQREEIYGYIDQEMNLIVSKTGIKQTIIKGVLEQIKQTFKLNRPIDGSEFSVNVVVLLNLLANGLLIIFVEYVLK